MPFPKVGEKARPLGSPRVAEDWNPELGVSEEDLAESIGRIGTRKAPRPDGVSARLCRLGRTNLLPKPGRSPDSPSAFKSGVSSGWGGQVARESNSCPPGGAPISWRRVIPRLQKGQYGFRMVRSTTDAIVRLRSLVEEAEWRGGMALAVSLDIANTFDSLPWGKMEEVLEIHRVPPYVEGVVRGYLRDRSIVCTGQSGGMIKRAVVCLRPTPPVSRVRRSASDNNTSGIGSDVLCRWHVL